MPRMTVLTLNEYIVPNLKGKNTLPPAVDPDHFKSISISPGPLSQWLVLSELSQSFHGIPLAAFDLIKGSEKQKMSEGFWERNYIVFMGTLLDVALSLSLSLKIDKEAHIGLFVSSHLASAIGWNRHQRQNKDLEQNWFVDITTELPNQINTEATLPLDFERWEYMS